MFAPNIGSRDKAGRLLIGFALLGLYLIGGLGSYGWVALLVGVILILTAILNFCPIWAALKINTRKE